MTHLALVSGKKIDIENMFILKLIGSIVVIIVLILLLKKLLVGTNLLKKGRNLEIIEILPLSSQSRLMIVRVYKKVFVLGESPAGISNLGVLSEKEIVDNIKLEQSVAVKPKDFKKVLEKFHSKMDAPDIDKNKNIERIYRQMKKMQELIIKPDKSDKLTK